MFWIGARSARRQSGWHAVVEAKAGGGSAVEGMEGLNLAAADLFCAAAI